MISKAKLKYIKSLQLKKYRKQEQCFIVEGVKSVQEILQSHFDVSWVAVTPMAEPKIVPLLNKHHAEVVITDEAALAQIGSFQTNDGALAIARMKENASVVLKPDEFALVLDDIRDPGNLGTIIRTADWYGITQIVASEETTDFYYPKVIAASMGSFCRVNVFYTNLPEYLKQQTATVYGTFLKGDDVHTTSFAKSGFIVMGNESNGISAEVEKCITHRITIPRKGGAESLNAAIATAIVLDNVMFGSQK